MTPPSIACVSRMISGKAKMTKQDQVKWNQCIAEVERLALLVAEYAKDAQGIQDVVTRRSLVRTMQRHEDYLERTLTEALGALNYGG